jgi:hypothetical protein
MAGVINFVEEQRQVYLHDFLVYVCGVDISAHVKEMKITYTDKSSPGSADITLTNPFDQWLLSKANLSGQWRSTADRYTESPKKHIFDNKVLLSRASIQQKVNPNVSLSQQVKAIQDPSAYGDYQPDVNPQNPQQDFLQRYAFGPGSCVFSRFDTVKIFIKNPVDPATADRWMPAFTGTVENKPVSTNYVTGESTVSLLCYDIRATLNYMRIGINPATNSSYSPTGALAGQQRSQNIFIDQDAAGFFKDYYPGLNSGDASKDPTFDQIFQGKSFVDMVAMITCGKSGWISSATDTTNTITTGQGIGFFTTGEVYRYANPKNTKATGKNLIRNLEAWDNLCLFGTRRNWWTYQQCNNVGINSFWLSSIKNKDTSFTPMNGKVHFLIPAEGLNISDMIKTSVAGLKNIMGSPEWSTRMSLISTACDMVDYDFSVTGNGDIIFEFPMYDFFPDNYGTNASIYSADKHIITDQISDEGGEVISAVEVQGDALTIAGQEINTQANAAPAGAAIPIVPKAIALSNILVAKYGVRIASKTFTGVAQGQLHYMATLELQKRLADANKMSIDLAYRPFLRPNRPLLHVTKGRIGRTTSVTLNLNSLRDATVSVAMNCVRTPLYIGGTGKNVQQTYQHIFGGPGMTLSYNTVLESPDPTGRAKVGGQNNSGITTNVDTAVSGK